MLNTHSINRLSKAGAALENTISSVDCYRGALCPRMSIEIRSVEKRMDRILTDISAGKRRNIDELSVMCRERLGILFLYRPTATSVDTTTAMAVQHRPCHPQLSTEDRPIYRPCADRHIDRVSTITIDRGPLYDTRSTPSTIIFFEILVSAFP